MITTETIVVYKSSEKGRRFITKRAAIAAEARAIIEKKYPNEKPECDERNGYCIYPGFYWKDDLERSNVLFRRLCRLISKSLVAI